MRLCNFILQNKEKSIALKTMEDGQVLLHSVICILLHWSSFSFHNSLFHVTCLNGKELVHRSAKFQISYLLIDFLLVCLA